MGTPSMGHQAALGMGAASPVTEQYEFIQCNLKKRALHVQSPGIRGTRSRIAESVTEGVYTVGGEIILEPRPDELDALLPRILGGVESADSFPLDETLGEFFVAVDKVAKVYEYAGCKVASARFRSAAGENLQLELQLEGKTETETAAGSFPNISSTLSAKQPYVHHQAVLTIASVSREVDNLVITIDNALMLDRFNNSQTRTALPETDRVITLSCDNPFTSDEADLYDLAIAGASGSVAFVNGGSSLTFTFANLKAPALGPAVDGRDREIPLRLQFTAYQSGATKELVVANVVV